MKNILNVVFVIIGTLIGAGFASGQEINLFFFSNGEKGIYGIIISCFLMGIIIFNTLKILDKYNIKNYKELLEILLGKYKEGYIKTIINLIVNIFILISFFIMIAGFGAYFEQEFGINGIIGSTILAILSYITFMNNVKGLIKVNQILVPTLIFFLVIIGIINIKDINILEINQHLIKSNNFGWLLDAILYSGYNSILLIPVIITLKNNIKSKKDIVLITSITTIITVILSLIIFLTLIKVDVNISNLEMPAVYVVSKISNIFRIIYGFIILGSIFTTSVSLGTSFLKNTVSSEKMYKKVAIVICVFSVVISNIGFSNLINLLYPLFGYLGIIQMIQECHLLKNIKTKNILKI